MEPIIVRDLNTVDYQTTWKRMRDFTDQRTAETLDELWLLEHLPVFTQGLAGKAEHVLNPHHIPIIHTDRGGQITYHGPGQLVAYPLIDLKRKNLYPKTLVNKLEKTVIALLNAEGISAYAKCDAPGVYVNNAKICSIGLRVRKNSSYHGIALNIAMDLTPFSYINPCGFPDMPMTQLKAFSTNTSISAIKKSFVTIFAAEFDYFITP